MLLVLLALAPSWAGKKMPSDRPTDKVRGQELYERHCMSCHGAENRGDGPATKALVHRVPNLADKIEVEEAIDAEGNKNGMIAKVPDDLVKVVMRGRGAMPAFAPSFPWADARRVLFYMGLVHLEPEEEEEAPKPKPKDDGKKKP